jgi:hypothetical protein
MKFWELAKETFFRRPFIRVVHLSWFAIYAILFLIPWPAEIHWQWGFLLFGWSGCLLPILISAGIFGDDIASNRICLIVTKPVQTIELYMYRLVGMSMQCAANILIGGLIMYTLTALTARGFVDRLWLWMLAAWLIANTWLAISASLSVIVRREHNSIILILGTIVVFISLSNLIQYWPEHIVTLLLSEVIKYACPSVEFLVKLLDKPHLARAVGYALYSLGLTMVYSIIGIVLLEKREFKNQPD